MRYKKQSKTYKLIRSGKSPEEESNMLKQTIKELDMTIGEFAISIKVSRQTIHNIIRDRKARLDTVLKIRYTYGLEPWDYLDGLDEVKKLANRAGN